MWPPDDYTANPANPPELPPEHPEEALAAFALNALDDAEFQAVFHHVVRCLHCQEVLLGFQETAARLTGSAPAGNDLPAGLKERVLSTAVGRPAAPAPPAAAPAALPPPDPRWSLPRLRRWLTPAIVSALCLMLAASIAFIALQQREISRLAAANESITAAPVVLLPAPSAAAAAAANARTPVSESRAASASTSAAAAPASAPAPAAAPAVAPQSAAAGPNSPAPTAPPDIPVAADAGNLLSRIGSSLNPSPDRNDRAIAGAAAAEAETLAAAGAGEVNLVKQEMADVVEATVLSAQPETEKLAMTSPLGTEPEAKGVLIVDPTGLRAVLMVSGMPADSYQIWLVRGNKQTLVDRIIVNDDDGAGVKHLQLRDSVFDFREVALLPDERHGPTSPTGAKFLSARIINGPPLPPRLPR